MDKDEQRKTTSKAKNSTDAFQEGVKYANSLNQLRGEVQVQRDWGLTIRITAIVASLIVGSIVGLVSLTLLFLVEYFNNIWKLSLGTSFEDAVFSWNPMERIGVAVPRSPQRHRQ